MVSQQSGSITSVPELNDLSAEMAVTAEPSRAPVLIASEMTSREISA